MCAQKDEAAEGAEASISAQSGAGDPERSPLVDPDIVKISGEERIAQGKAARGKAPRSGQSLCRSPVGHRDPVDLLVEQTNPLVRELLPLRYGRMLVSPFAFLRGSALTMTADLASTASSGLTAQLCGDAHLANFGVFGTPDGGRTFDMNDFDETASGPFEWDVKRLGVSLEVAGRENDFSGQHRKQIVKSTLRSYRETMAGFASMSMIDVWNSHLDTTELLRRFQLLLDTDKTPSVWYDVAEARAHEGCQSYGDLIRKGDDDEPRFVSDPPAVVPLEELGSTPDLKWIPALVRSYVNTLHPEVQHLLDDYQIAHAARKVSGVGGVGRDSWVVLLVDEPNSSHVLLQVRQAEESVLERFWSKSTFSNHGHRVVHGQRLMQASDDIFLGWERNTRQGSKRDYYVRRLAECKASAEVAGMTAAAMELWGRMCGWALARAHARSGDRIAISSYLGRSDSFDRAIARFSRAYGDQNERDYEMLQRAVRKGRLVAEACA